ncbi:MAG: AAC(3) family N-acetyltransferase [Chitinophagaceae bacterium]|nr:AAC(3) family N-acetyltransferase [Chitinophagaceae bacterium]
MSEKDLISERHVPSTRASLARQLRDGGLKTGTCVLVHTSMNNLGWIAGGPIGVIQALTDAIGPEGTLVMPSHTNYLTDPAGWVMPPVPANWIDTIRNEMPAYDPAISPTKDMGAVAELFRTWPGVKRSLHPTCSFSAVGILADKIVADHFIEDPLGETSPLGKLYAEDAQILLLGVAFDVCTMLHLAEQRAWPERPKNIQGSPIMEAGRRIWKVYKEPALIDSRHFLPIGERLQKEKVVKKFPIGIGEAMMISSKILVDHAVHYWKTIPPPDDAGRG